MLPFKLVYHERYDLNLGAHVFPSEKFRLIHDKLLNDGIAEPDDFLRPEPASDQMKLEVPYSPELVHAFWLAAGGTITAAESALQDGFGCNIGGGFHHAYPGHGEGFCAIHDVAVAIRTLQARKKITRAMVVDTDVHHGNGTAAIFSKDDSVFTLSIHQLNNYPAHKPHSSLDLNLEDGVADEEYLATRLPAVKKSVESFQPDILFYVGGADPYREDQLGGLDLSMEGLKKRDTGVFTEARRKNIPVVTTLAGGYARQLNDTIQIHVNTILAAKQVAEDSRQSIGHPSA